MGSDQRTVHLYRPPTESGVAAAAAPERLRLFGSRVRFDEERGNRHLERVGETVEQIDGGVPLLALKLAHPGSIDARVSRQALLGKRPGGA